MPLPDEIQVTEVLVSDKKQVPDASNSWTKSTCVPCAYKFMCSNFSFCIPGTWILVSSSSVCFNLNNFILVFNNN